MPQLKSVTVFAPGSVGNAGVGFDIMGFAIDGIGDKVMVKLSDENSNELLLTGEYGHLIPATRNKNTAGVAVDAFLKWINKEIGLKITLEKNMPLGSGLGSSASSAAAAVFAVNELLGRPLNTKELIPFAMEGERIACGSAHADNVAPALLGGFILIRSNEPLDIFQVPVPQDLYSAVVHPHYELLTSQSRAVLKQQISLKDAISQSANASSFILSLINSDYELMKRSFVDLIAEPYRKSLIPAFDPVKAAALKSGAIGCSISGSGPSVFAICRGEAEALKIASEMELEFNRHNFQCDVFISPVNSSGAKVVDTK